MRYLVVSLQAATSTGLSMNRISKGIREIVYPAGASPVRFMDYRIDGRSFEAYLREVFPGTFSEGRFREVQVPTLAGTLDDAALRETVVENVLPPDSETRCCLIYCCHDGCCPYGYVEVHRRGDMVIWQRFGLNAAFSSNREGEEDGIVWLADFEPLHFTLEDYRAMVLAFRE